MTQTMYDVMIIGAGPGGYVAAIRAAQLGLKTAIVEREHLGGICLNWGCIPTKALLRSTEILTYMRDADAFGIDVENVKPNVSAMVKRSREVSAKLNSGVTSLLRKNKIDVIWGEAKITAPGKIQVAKSQKPIMQPAHPAPKNVKGEGEYQAKNIIIATGARPKIVPGFEPDGKLILTYFEAMVPKKLPETLLIMGSGAIGAEFASIYQALGVNVTIVEMLPNILPQEDTEISDVVLKAFKKRGIQILTTTKALSLEKSKNNVKVTLVDEAGKQREETFDQVISAVGVVPNTQELGLEKLGVKFGSQGIETNSVGASSLAGIYAIGDVTGAPMLAHRAEHQGVVCVEAIASKVTDVSNIIAVPSCTYCQPQVASVGLSEVAAKSNGYEVRVGRFPFMANGKAVAMGETSGLIKTIFDNQTGELLGAHMVGPEVTELIQGFVTAIGHETTDEHLKEIMYPHPTLSEAMHESVLDAFDAAIHI